MPKPTALARVAALAALCCAGLLGATPVLAQPAAPPAAAAASPAPQPVPSPPHRAGTVAAAAAPTPAAGSEPAGNATGDDVGNEAGEAPAPPAPSRPVARPTLPPSVPLAAASAIAAADQAELKTIDTEVSRLEAEQAQARSDDSLTRVRQDAAAAQASADAFARAREAEVTALDQQLKRYSTPSGRTRPRLTAEEARARADLLSRRKQAAVLVKDAEQAASTASGVYNAVATRRRTAFASHVFQRTASPLEAGFWSSLAASLGPDLVRLDRLARDVGAAAASAPEPRAAISVAVSLALAFLLAWPLHRLGRRLVRRRVQATETEAPPAPLAAGAGAHSRSAADLGRSAHAVGAVLVDTLAPGLAAVAVNLGLTWGQLLSDKAGMLAETAVIAVFWGAAVVALSRQLAGEPEERLLPVSEAVAGRLRVLPWMVAAITGAGFLLTRINVVVGASVAATIAANCVVALAYAAVASLVLVALGADRQDETDAAEADADVRQPGRVLLSLALSAAILVTVGAVLSGFSTFGHLVASQIFWISVIAGVAYVLLRFADDLTAELFAPRGWFGRLLTGVLNLRQPIVDQIGVLSSAGVQLLIMLGALSLALTPFGNNGDLLAERLGHFGQTVHVGSLVISPGSVFAGLLSLIVGLVVVHFVERWVNRRYLPVTDWDSGVRNSVATGVRYLGVGLTILWALAAAGLGFKQIALVASALSVGIGFGLQQIVQNFVSGLILLVERPVKLGDWINLGAGVEGDVQRIRVRSTEIRTFDRTTVIVPNSDLITKQVQNKTLGDPRGRVRLEVSVGAPADAPRASRALADLLAGDEEVLKEPPPRVFVDSLTTGGSVNYVCFAYVASPRDAMGVKSRLYTEVLDLFAREKIGFVGGPAVNVMEPGPEMRSFVNDLAEQLKRTPPPPAADKA